MGFSFLEFNNGFSPCPVTYLDPREKGLTSLIYCVVILIN